MTTRRSNHCARRKPSLNPPAVRHGSELGGQSKRPGAKEKCCTRPSSTFVGGRQVAAAWEGIGRLTRAAASKASRLADAKAATPVAGWPVITSTKLLAPEKTP